MLRRAAGIALVSATKPPSADIAGATLHSVSRILTVWKKAGMLASHNQRLAVRKMSDIQRIAADSAD